jgi:hypothetical protein
MPPYCGPTSGVSTVPSAGASGPNTAENGTTTGQPRGTGRHTARTRAARTGEWGTIWRMLDGSGTGRGRGGFGITPGTGLGWIKAIERRRVELVKELG